MVETDTYKLISIRLLSQRDCRGTLYLSAFYFKKHSSSEAKYEIYDKEYMAIVRFFVEWGL